MPEPIAPDIILFICNNTVSPDGRLPRQWRQDGAHVLVRQVPCSGKMDGQYLLNAMEGGLQGICVVTCPKGKCQLAQGNIRAEVRIGTIRRLLSEIGLEPERAELVECPNGDVPGQLEKTAREAVARICAIGTNPIRAASQANQQG